MISSDAAGNPKKIRISLMTSTRVNGAPPGNMNKHVEQRSHVSDPKGVVRSSISEGRLGTVIINRIS